MEQGVASLCAPSCHLADRQAFANARRQAFPTDDGPSLRAVAAGRDGPARGASLIPVPRLESCIGLADVMKEPEDTQALNVHGFHLPACSARRRPANAGCIEQRL